MRPQGWVEVGWKSANDWWKANESTILAKQDIAEQKKRHNIRPA